jgi:Co/Zn/Cd efflux system component
MAEKSSKKPPKFEDHTGMTLYILQDHPMTFEQVLTEFKRMELSISFNYRHFFEKKTRRNRERAEKLKKDLALLQTSGHIKKLYKEEKYQITELGKENLKVFHGNISKVRTTIRTLLNPKYSAIASLAVHCVIGILKLVGAGLTGSAGLLGDGIDSTIDAVSSIIVGVAMRYNKEKQAAYLLILLMCGSGLMIFYESIKSALSSESLSHGIFGIIATSLSILLCAFLFLYQRVVGYAQRNLAVLAQSEDSKNHIVVGFLVLAGVVLGNYQLSIVDSVVGALIGLLILRAAYELFRDVRAASRGEEINYDKYKLGIFKRMESFQKQMIDFWAIWKIDSGYNKMTILSDEFKNAFTTRLDEFLYLEVNRKKDANETVTEKITMSKQLSDLNKTIDALLTDGYLQKKDDTLFLTQKGKKYLKKKMGKIDRRRHKK